jgi:hypothetical protein
MNDCAKTDYAPGKDPRTVNSSKSDLAQSPMELYVPDGLIGEVIGLLAKAYRRSTQARESRRDSVPAGVAGPEAKSVHGGIE